MRRSSRVFSKWSNERGLFGSFASPFRRSPDVWDRSLTPDPFPIDHVERMLKILVRTQVLSMRGGFHALRKGERARPDRAMDALQRECQLRWNLQEFKGAGLESRQCHERQCLDERGVRVRLYGSYAKVLQHPHDLAQLLRNPLNLRGLAVYWVLFQQPY